VFDIEHRALGIRQNAACGAARGCSERTAERVDFVRNSAHIEISLGRWKRLARIVLSEGAEGESMSASAVAEIATHVECEVPEVTLWELIWAVTEVADDEREVVATIAHMLTSGSVRVVGNPRDRGLRFAS
jgi:hypothetical protein